VGGGVDLDQVHGAVGGADDPEPLVADLEPAGVAVQPIQPGIDRRCVVDADPEPVRSQLVHGHPVGVAAQLEVDRPLGLVPSLWPAAVRGREEVQPLALLLHLVRLDGRDHQGDAGVQRGHQPPLTPHPVDPAGVGAAVDDLGLVQQVEQEALVGGAALDDDGRLRERPAQPGQCLVPGGAEGDDLGDHGVEVGRNQVAAGETGVHPDPGTGRQVEQRDPARRRREVPVGILGVEPGLDRVADLDRSVTVEGVAGRHPQLGLDQVGGGGQLGDRVLHLQPGIDLEEGEDLVDRLVQELHRAGAAVADRQRQPLRRRLDLGLLLGCQHDRGRLLDHLLVAALDGAVTYADGPRRALSVGDHLNLDVPGTGDQGLQEHHAAAEGTGGLVARLVEDRGQVLVRADDPDAPATTTGGRLQHQRVTELGGMGQRGRQVLDWATAPRRHRNADLLGQQLGTDLVAQRAHRGGRGPDEGDADPLAQLCEGGVLGDEAPAHPHRVRSGFANRPFEDVVIEVRAGSRRPQRVRQVGLADEFRRTLGLSVQRDGLDPGQPGRVELTYGVDQPHGGFSPVDNRDASEHLPAPSLL